MVFPFALLVLTYISSAFGITCRDCKDIAAPSECRDTLICGPEEVCFTREFTDRLGLKGFRMGCADKNTCDLLQKAKVLFGKRSSDVNPAPADKCYECCSTEECNAFLCEGSTGGGTIVTTGKPPVTTTTIAPQCSNQGCPENFVRFKDHCYLFSVGSATWLNARKACHLKGADIVSITSKEEHEFLKQQLVLLNARFTQQYWTAAAYSHSVGEWQWVDGAAFTYTAWSSSPPTQFNRNSDYYIYILNPAYDPSNKGLFASISGGSYYLGIICKRRI